MSTIISLTFDFLTFKKLTDSQLSPPHGTQKLKCETKNKMMSMIGPVQSRCNEGSLVGKRSRFWAWSERVMDDESGDDNRDELTSEWGGESRHDWQDWRNDLWIRELIAETRWCIPVSEWAISDFQWDGWWARKGDNRWRAGTARKLNRDQIVKNITIYYSK